MQPSKRNVNRPCSILSVIAALLACLLLAACGAEPGAPDPMPETETASDTASAVDTEAPAPARPTGLVEVSGLEPREGELLVCAVPDGEGAALLLQRWDQAAQRSCFRVCFLDPETAAVTASAELAMPEGQELTELLPGISGLKTGPEELCLLDDYNERCAAFDRQGRFLALRDWPVQDPEHLGWQNGLLGSDVFWKDAGLAYHISQDGQETALGFYDEEDRIHLLEELPCDSFPASWGHRVLAVENQIEPPERLYALLDLDQGLILDRLRLPEQDEAGRWQNPCGQVLGPDWVLLALTESGEEEEFLKLLFWYPEQARPEPLAQRVLDSQSLGRELETLSSALEAQGLHILLDTAPPPELTPTTGLSEPESTCETGSSLYGQYLILRSLKNFADKLPQGFLRELYTDLPGADAPAWETLNIYVVREIPGDATAFANSWTDNLLICFATQEFEASHPAHEFMHIMDRRLEQQLWTQGRCLEEEWQALSPDFAYDGDLSPEQQEALEGYFVSWYAQTNGGEDRAETFQYLFDVGEPLATHWRYQDSPGVQAKAAWLVQALREAFPSVQAQEQVWWEQWLP